MRGRLLVAGVVLVAAPLAPSLWSIWRFQPASAPTTAPLSREARGAIHVHSRRSDGAGTLDEIALAARAAGLDFVVVTDHRDLDALGRDEYRHGVLLLKGVELSTHGGHILALGIDRPDFRFDGAPDKVFDDIESLGGFSVVAHPFSFHPDRRFSHQGRGSFDAVEIWNGSEDFRSPKAHTLSGALASILNRRYGLLRAFGAGRESLDFWDEALARAQPVVALAGADAHGGIDLGFHFLRFPDYRHLFELFSNHLLLDAPLDGTVPRDRALVTSALERGRVFLALDGLARPTGFRFRAESEGTRASMGDALGASSARLIVEAPDIPSNIVLFKDSRIAARVRGPELTYAVDEPGIYRVEVHLRGSSPLDTSIPWIVSNPIYLGLPDRAQTTTFEGSAVPGDGILVEDFDRGALVGWDTASDARGRVSAPRLEGPGALGSPRALSFDFRMGDREPAESRSHCALTGPVPTGISEARGLSFRYRASGVFRFDLQLRDENPETSDGIEPWRTSLKTTTGWKRAYISFEELESYHPQSDGRFDPDRSRGLAIYLDTATVRPGLQGTLWIDDIRLHPR